MNKARAVLVTVLLSLAVPLAPARSPQEAPSMKPDRATHGLRGPVKSCIEEIKYTSTTGAPLPDSQQETFYDAEGRVVTQRNRNPDSTSWSTRYEYSGSGQLVRILSGTNETASSETTYSYDQQGRLHEITTSDGRPPVSFRYDEHGRKTKIQTQRPEDYRGNMASGGEPFEGLDNAPPNLPGGGTETTIYDDQDRPTEVQIRNTAGELVSRALRVYDESGHVVEEKQIHDNFLAQIPPETMAKLVEQSGLPMDQFKQQLQSSFKQFMGGRDSFSVKYRYDSHGRVTHTSRKIFNNVEEEIETAYNDHGDIMSEITRSTMPDPRADPSLWKHYSEARYSYQHDEHGNWIEKSSAYRTDPDADFQPLTVITRTISYY